tara:strand:- start:1364 stop:1735 length:372 start_codon:yes stop_codon:yes gene_type:complete
MAHVIDYESIIQNAENIGKDSELLSKIEMDEKYKEFKERYPKFYKHIIDGNFDVNYFRQMISVREQAVSVSEGDETEKSFNGDVAVGEFLARRYVYPIQKPSQGDLEQAFVKAKNTHYNDRNK